MNRNPLRRAFLATAAALLVAAAASAVEHMGMPECELALAQAAVYLAVAPKSNAIYSAYSAVKREVGDRPGLAIPMQLRNAPTRLMKDAGYGAGYRYAHDEPQAYAAGETDEFIHPTVIGSYRGLQADEVVISFNFRKDRPRQIVASLADPLFDGFDRGEPRLADVTCMMQYERALGLPFAFTPDSPAVTLAQVLGVVVPGTQGWLLCLAFSLLPLVVGQVLELIPVRRPGLV